MSQIAEIDRHPYKRQSHRWQELLCREHERRQIGNTLMFIMSVS